MKPALASARYLLFAVLALPTAGCGGCTGIVETPDWDDWAQESGKQLCLQSFGPAILTSALGAAAPPGGAGGLNAIGTELAWRSCFEQQAKPLCDPAVIASAVGAAAPPGGCGGLTAVSALVGQDAHREAIGKPLHLPSLFEVQQPHQPKTIRREVVW